jgi:lipase chaperone LimK
MDKKHRAALVIAAVCALCLLFVLFHVLKREDAAQQGYVFDKNSNIKLKDIETYFQVVDFREKNPRDYFQNSAVNRYTLQFLMFLDSNFKEFDNEKDLFGQVEKYLHENLPAETADRLFELYKKFVKYQRTLGERSREWGMPKTTEDAIALLHKLQEHRREIFGKDLADLLFGPSVKAEEYPLRRGAIVADKNLYGAEKEKMLRQLNEDMWGEEADQVEAYAEPYVRYKEKLAMYEKDMAEMDEAGKKAKIRAIREEIFTPEQIQGLEEVDHLIEREQSREKAYRAKEAEIINDPRLEPTEKEEKIKKLQDQMYGEEADALRRRLAIERGANALWKK